MSFLKIVAFFLTVATLHAEGSVLAPALAPAVAPAISYAHLAPPSTVPFAASVSTFTKGLPYLAAPYAAGILPGLPAPALAPAPAILPGLATGPALFPGAALGPSPYAAGPLFAGAPALAAPGPLLPAGPGPLLAGGPGPLLAGGPGFLSGPYARSVHAVAAAHPGLAPALAPSLLGRYY